MTLVPGAVVAMVVLSASGCLPVVALVGFRWFAVPLCALLGAVFAAIAATCCLGVGGSTMGWFVVVAALGAAATVAWWWLRPGDRPWAGSGLPSVPGHRITGAVAALAISGACAWCLRALSTPTVGFDARAVWLMRAGWFLQPHHQLVADMSSGGILLSQTSYPPLVSAAGSVAWFVTGDHSMRLGAVVIALLNACALAAAAFAVVECGRQATRRLWSSPGRGPVGDVAAGGRPRRSVAGGRPRRAVAGGRPRRAVAGALPSVVGVVGAVSLVLVTFGVAEPFMTNGYADPIWSIAAVGAVAYGLQIAGDRSTLGAAAILVIVAGMSKDEGAATAVLLIALLVVRRVRVATAGRHDRWWRPVVAGSAGLLLVGAWPATVRLLHLRDVNAGGAPAGAYLHRAHQAIDGLAPYLHVVLLAVPLAVACGLVLTPVRRATAIAHDGWAWSALVAAMVVIVGAYATGTADVPAWLVTTAHRVTEFPALEAWWIIAVAAVTASAAPAYRRSRPAGTDPSAPSSGSATLPATDGPGTRGRSVSRRVPRRDPEQSRTRDRTVVGSTKEGDQ